MKSNRTLSSDRLWCGGRRTVGQAAARQSRGVGVGRPSGGIRRKLAGGVEDDREGVRNDGLTKVLERHVGGRAVPGKGICTQADDGPREQVWILRWDAPRAHQAAEVSGPSVHDVVRIPARIEVGLVFGLRTAVL